MGATNLRRSLGYPLSNVEPALNILKLISFFRLVWGL